MDTEAVHHTECLFSSQLMPVPIYTASGQLSSLLSIITKTEVRSATVVLELPFTFNLLLLLL